MRAILLAEKLLLSIRFLLQGIGELDVGPGQPHGRECITGYCKLKTHFS
jgi:hypothetical protein